MKVFVEINCPFRYKENIIRPMSREVTVMNAVNNFASVNFGHCEKSKHFALDLRISLGAVSLGIFLSSKAKRLDFHNTLK